MPPNSDPSRIGFIPERGLLGIGNSFRSPAPAGTSGTVSSPAIDGTTQLTGSARGSAEQSGRNTGQKAGLNREILNTGWSQLRRMLEYKAAHVEAIAPMYTSQTCRRCDRADPASRRSQSEFECVHCGHKGNADVNAALNIMASATGAAGRRGALALATPTNRQHVCERRAA